MKSILTAHSLFVTVHQVKTEKMVKMVKTAHQDLPEMTARTDHKDRKDLKDLRDRQEIRFAGRRTESSGPWPPTRVHDEPHDRAR